MNARSSERVFRSLALAIGLGGTIYGLIDAAEIAHQARFAAGWWTPLAVVAIFGGFVLLAPMSFTAPMRLTRAVAAVATVGYLIALVLTPMAFGHGGIHTQAVWPFRYPNLVGVAAILVWPRRIAYPYLALVSVIAASVNGYVLAHPGWIYLAGDFSRAFLIALLTTSCCSAALRMGTTLDRETTVAERHAASLAAAEASEQERGRFAALIHDNVLSTLLEASRTRNDGFDVVVRQAKSTVAQLDEIRRAGTTSPSDSLAADAVISLLRNAVHAVNREVQFNVTTPRSPNEELDMSTETARVVTEALTEAVRNSLRHAGVPGRPVARTVTVTVGAGGLRIVLTDDGTGFDLDAVPEHRLGIAISILGRMRRLPGGAGFIESTPGAGTTVTLVWGGNGDH